MKREGATYFTEMCSGSEAGSYLRPIDFVYHSTLGLRAIQKKRRHDRCTPGEQMGGASFFFFFITLNPKVECYTSL